MQKENEKITVVQLKVSLVRALGLFTSTLIVAGIMIGTGVFKKIIPMAQTGFI